MSTSLAKILLFDGIFPVIGRVGVRAKDYATGLAPQTKPVQDISTCNFKDASRPSCTVYFQPFSRKTSCKGEEVPVAFQGHSIKLMHGEKAELDEASPLCFLDRHRGAHIITALGRDGALQVLDGAIQLAVTSVVDATSCTADPMYRFARYVLREQFDGFLADRCVELGGREMTRLPRHYTYSGGGKEPDSRKLSLLLLAH